MATCTKHGIDRIQRFSAAGKKDGTYCPKCAAERTARRRGSDPRAVLDERLWTYYRIRLVEFERLYAAQNGRCAACGLPGDPNRRGYAGTGLVVDHDHACCSGYENGERPCGNCVRGLLCSDCNVTIGRLREDPVRIRAVADYVERLRK